MTARVKVACVDCGDLLLRPEQVRLFTTPNQTEARYAFTCTGCGAWINRPTVPYLLRALRQAGVPECRQRVPRELFEEHRGPAISADEVCDFLLEVQVVDDLARFACRR